MIDRVRRIELYAVRAVSIVVFDIGFVIGDKIWPSKKPGFSCLVEFIITTRPVNGINRGIGTDLSPINVACFRVNGYPPWISVSHDKYLRLCLSGSFREQVSIRN